jgi:aspartate-semialdehyde dehydrogenase
MKAKMNVGIIGATGMVGQYLITLLMDHPWFTVTYVAASQRSAGKYYGEAVRGRWHLACDIPPDVRDLNVADVHDSKKAMENCSLVFSAVKLDAEQTRELECQYAREGCVVVSANSAHRGTEDVPVLIPEINHHHLGIIKFQRMRNNWDKGLIVVKPNCSLQSYLTPIYAIREAGYTIDNVIVTTLQGVSGAGYPGHSVFDVIDNTIPLPGEEVKSEMESAKILGIIQNGRIEPDVSMRISAHCNRVPILHGHSACVSMDFKGQKPSIEGIISIWKAFKSRPQELNLPFAPAKPIIYLSEIDRPQPRLDRDADRGMAITTGRLRECNVFDYKFLCLSHNLIRGAAGGAILIAELLHAGGFLAGE